MSIVSTHRGTIAGTLLLVVALLAPGPTGAQSPPERREPESRAPELGKGAEEVATRLRELTRSLSDTEELAALEAEVAADSHRAAQVWDDTGHLLERTLRTTALDSLTTSWQALRSDLEDLDRRIAQRAARREADLATLTNLHASWTRALDLARKADAPPAVLESAQNTVAAIEQTRTPIAQRRARVLVLQDSVTRAMQTCDDALTRLGDARQEAIKRALHPQEPAVWRRSRGADFAGAGTASHVADLATKVVNLRTYLTAYRGRLVLSLLMVLALMILLRRVRAQPGDDATPMSIQRTPYASAILIGLLVSRPLRPNPPFEFQQVVLAVVMIAAALVFRPLLEVRLAAAVYLCCALLVASLATQLLEPSPALEQLLLMAEMSITAGLLFWGAAQFAETRALGFGAPLLRRLARVMTRLLALVCGASAVAAALGYLDLADFLGLGTFFALLLTVGLLAVRLAFQDLVEIALARGPLARLHTVVRHRTLIATRTRTGLDVLLMATWLSLTLARFQLLEPARDVARAILETRLRAGELDLPVAHVLAFVVVVVGVFVTTRLVSVLLEEDVFSRMTLSRGVPYALSTLARYTLLLAGFLLALATLGLDLTRITVLVSALGLGLGFGLQQIMNNFVSGLILLFERPVNVGDYVQMGDLMGNVLRIGIRSSTVRTSQGAEVIVPNSKLIEEKVTNWTLSDRRRRIDLDIGIKGDVDAERIISILLDVAHRDPRVGQTPPPEALLVRFGEDATDFQLRFWTEDAQWTRVRSDLSITLQRTLRAVRIGGADQPGTEPRSADSSTASG